MAINCLRESNQVTGKMFQAFSVEKLTQKLSGINMSNIFLVPLKWQGKECHANVIDRLKTKARRHSGRCLRKAIKSIFFRADSAHDASNAG